MRTMSLLLLFLFGFEIVASSQECCPSGAKSVNAECFRDAGGRLQNAIDCGAPLVNVAPNGYWILNDTLYLNVSKQTLHLGEGVILEARKNLFHSSGAVLLRIDQVSGVTVSGYGATLMMHKEQYSNKTLYNHSEWRHGISVTSASSILIEGVTVVASGGDGINIGGNTNVIHTVPNSVDVHVRDVNLTDNYRNAMSVTGVDGLLVENSLLAKTGGTCCMGGVDIEPETPLRKVTNITFTNCTFENNEMAQVVMNLGGQEGNNVDITFDSCLVRNSPREGMWILGVKDNAPSGSIKISNCIVENTGDFGMRFEKINATGATIEVTNSTLTNVAYKGHFPILIQAGGVSFNDVVVNDTDHTRNWLEAGWRTSQPVTNVVGNVTVYTKSECTNSFNKSRGDNWDINVTCYSEKENNRNGEQNADYPIYWWVWTMNNTNITNAGGLQPMTKVQLGGHCITNNKKWTQGNWPSLTPKLKNGGIPQLANLTEHLEEFSTQLQECVPDTSYNGYIILDLEEWDPVWEMNNCSYDGFPLYPDPSYCNSSNMWRGQYQQASIAHAERENPTMPLPWVINIAKKEFETAAMSFMENTIKLGKRMRPNATWGIYMVPYKVHGPCVLTNDSEYLCGFSHPTYGPKISALYEQLTPLWQTVDAIFPSIYVSGNVSMELQRAYVASNVGMAKKLANMNKRVDSNGVQRPTVVPFGELYYHGSFGPVNANIEANTLHYANNETCAGSTLLNITDNRIQVEAAYNNGADALVLWSGGVLPYMRYQDCRQQLLSWLNTTLFPEVKSFSEQLKNCRDKLCNGHGRCINLTNSGYSSCVCDKGFMPPFCTT
eukprot:m.262101 g.262101  ORF g.262101 m.262101 type:complete len:833 (-) comp16222_c0_seq1:188-2686(-)